MVTHVHRELRGRRVPWPEGAWPAEIEPLLQPGDFAGPWRGLWLACAPDGATGTLTPELHTIEEHEDGTISVQPSLDYRITGGMAEPSAQPGDYDATHAFDLMYVGRRWHGWLKRGVWTAV